MSDKEYSSWLVAKLQVTAEKTSIKKEVSAEIEANCSSGHG